MVARYPNGAARRLQQAKEAAAKARNPQGNSWQEMHRRQYRSGLSYPALSRGSAPAKWFADSVDMIPWRYLGSCDAVAKRESGFRSIDHQGWYTDREFQDETMHGHVWQLPARKGKPLYVPGVVESMSGIVTLYMGDIKESPMEAARCSDECARIAAEKECDYQQAWRSRNQWEELSESIASAREGLQQLLREIRAAKEAGQHGTPVICETLKREARRQWRQIARDREAREELESSWSETWSRELAGPDGVIAL